MAEEIQPKPAVQDVEADIPAGSDTTIKADENIGPQTFIFPEHSIKVDTPVAGRKPFSFTIDLWMFFDIEETQNQNEDNAKELARRMVQEIVLLPDDGYYFDDLSIDVFPSSTALTAMVRLITPKGPVDVFNNIIYRGDLFPLILPSRYGPVKAVIIRIMPTHADVPPSKAPIELTVTATGTEVKGLGTVEVEAKQGEGAVVYLPEKTMVMVR